VKAARPGTCPTCGKPAAFAPDNPWRPFCCERCKSIDLGGWASEAYRIPAEDDEEGAPPATENPQ
jgi:endogenous inhibitor of DNA gyrase (YacG/DUF329 family)